MVHENEVVINIINSKISDKTSHKTANSNTYLTQEINLWRLKVQSNTFKIALHGLIIESRTNANEQSKQS